MKRSLADPKHFVPATIDVDQSSSTFWATFAIRPRFLLFSWHDVDRQSMPHPPSRAKEIEDEDDDEGRGRLERFAKGFSFATTTTHTVILPHSVTPELLQLLNSFGVSLTFDVG